MPFTSNDENVRQELETALRVIIGDAETTSQKNRTLHGRPFIAVYKETATGAECYVVSPGLANQFRHMFLDLGPLYLGPEQNFENILAAGGSKAQ